VYYSSNDVVSILTAYLVAAAVFKGSIGLSPR